MKAEWLANVNGQEYGPYSWDQMLQMAAEGRVPADLPVRRVSDKKWLQAGQVPGLVHSANADSQPTTSTPPPPPATNVADSQHKRTQPPANARPTPPPPPKQARSPASSPSPAPPPVPQQSVAPWPVIVTEPPQEPETNAEGMPEQLPLRRTSPLLIVGVLAGVAAIVLLGGGTIVWLVWSRGLATSGTESVAEASQAVPGISAGSSESNQPEEPDSAKTADDGPTESELAAQAKTVRSISSWQSIAGVRGFRVANASLQITRVWRASAESQGAEAEAGGNYVCVEVTINNQSKSPLRYKGWNTFGATGAILADESKQVLPLIPIAQTQEMGRLTSGSVPGGESIKEVLVFKAPAREDEVLHLVLPWSAFYSNVKPPYRAIELTPDVMGMDLASQGGGRAPAVEAQADPQGTGESRPAATEGAKSKGTPPMSIKEMVDNDPGTPLPPDQPSATKAGGKGDNGKQEPGKDAPKNPENPFEPKPNAEKPAEPVNPLDPLSVIPKEGEDGSDP